MGKPQSKSPGSARAGSSSAEAKTAKKAAAPRPKKAAKEGAKKKAQDDVVLVHGRDENGGLHVLRKKGEELSANLEEQLALVEKLTTEVASISDSIAEKVLSYSFQLHISFQNVMKIYQILQI